MAKSDFDAFCRDCFDLLRRSRVRSLVIGGLAVIALGEPRLTGDVDLVVFVSEADAERLIRMAGRSGFDVDPELERQRLRETGTLRFRRPPFQLDLIRASMAFEEAAYERSSRRRLFGTLVRFPSPEDLILFKVLAARDKDILDAVGVARRHRERLDVRYLGMTMTEICELAEDLAPWRRLEAALAKADLKLSSRRARPKPTA